MAGLSSPIIFVVLFAAFTCTMCQFYPGYYGYYGYGYYGNYFGCRGNGWYNVYCPDRSITPGSCAGTLSCSQFAGYTCVSPGICCRTATTTNTCPTGLVTGFGCNTLTNFGCATGQQCINGFCCLSSIVATCPNGLQGAGTCVNVGGTLGCGTPFVCTLVNSQPICCPTTATTSFFVRAAAQEVNLCPTARKHSGKCDDKNKCKAGYVCYNFVCCPAVGTRSSIATAVCFNNAEPTGICSKNDTSCTDSNSSCREDNGFCCPKLKKETGNEESA